MYRHGSCESGEERAARLIRCERYELGIDYYERHAEMLSAVTGEDVQRACVLLFDPDRRSMVVVGPSPIY